MKVQSQYTPFQTIVDNFGNQFPQVFLEGERFTDYETIMQELFDQKELELDKQQQILRKIRDGGESNDIMSQARLVMAKVMERQALRKEMRAKLQVRDKLGNTIESLLQAGSIQNLYLKVEELGLKPSKYLPYTSALMKAASQFEDSVMNMLALIAGIIDKDICPAQLEIAFEKARQFLQAQRDATLGESSSSSMQDQNKQNDQIFAHNLDSALSFLIKSEDQMKEAHRDFLQSLKSFQIQSGLVNLTTVGMSEFCRMIRNGGHIKNIRVIVSGKLEVEVIPSKEYLCIQNVEFQGSDDMSDPEEIATCLVLEGKKGQSIEVIDCIFNHSALVISKFDNAKVEGVSFTGAQYGLCIRYTTNASVSYCSIQNCKFGFMFDILVSLDLKNCNAIDNKEWGFIFKDILAGANIEKCTSLNNQKVGALIFSAKCSLFKCTLTGNGESDIEIMDDRSKVEVKECIIGESTSKTRIIQK
eukprot:TRINITY_DN37262_c0_g1_i2.p1 TRINITY_DN37262_c0_g1~~TRINITY_DN37262_c0_g1_i2.p1  ORF type:complete len:473 (+),score=30.38 TRINITY_DN37262_c0_g1_i2:2-1420(+)